MEQLYTAHCPPVGDTPWEHYPRPQMRRESYVNLNGPWDFTIQSAEALPQDFDGKIIVPFCPESALSGVQTQVKEGSFLFYRRYFTLPEGFHRGKVLLHFGAVDQSAKIYVNQKCLGSHVGGYEAFTVDITDALDKVNELVVVCRDELDLRLPYGKQKRKRGGMWYTPVSGIWQSVWLESVPGVYVEKLKIENRGNTVYIQCVPALDGRITVKELGTFPMTGGKAEITPENPHLWSPEDPYLYDFTVETEQDRVESYFAIRQLEIRMVGDTPRLCLNGKPYFFHGLLDQGYWPDGIYTPPRPACYAQDIQAMKDLGFNTLRKHIKVEPEEFYYQCDKLGMVVFQDMVNNSPYSFLKDTVLPTVCMQKLDDRKRHRDPVSRENFLQGMEAAVRQLENHPCILYWTIFNEGWGQFDSDRVYDRFMELDDTRFVDATSGWFRQKKSQVESLHIYFGSWNKLKKTDKPLVLSEFGGYTYAVEGHLFNTEKSYGYKTCKDPEQFKQDLIKLYRQKVLPAIGKGLCAAIYTQVSDVEDEINGLLTYDRQVCKVEPEQMRQMAEELYQEMEKCTQL